MTQPDDEPPSRLAQILKEDESLAQTLPLLAEDLVHDEFIDTTWPACPTHPNHPLWLTEGKPWMWECRQARSRIPVGQLSSLGGASLPPDSS